MVEFVENKKKIWVALQIAFILFVVVGCGGKATKEKASENTEGKTVTAGAPIEEPSKDGKPEGPLPVMTFSETLHDFGTIDEGEKVSYKYMLKNTGDAPLVIQQARPSCGCTVSAFTKQPIPVGGTGFVEVEFNSEGKPNTQNKAVTVTANTWPKTTTLHFKAFVTPKSQPTE